MAQVVQKRLDFIKYRSTVPIKDIPIEFLGWPAIDASTSLNFVDMSDSIAANSSLVHVGSIISTSTTNSLTLNNLNVLITDKYRTASTGQIVPYFFTHTINDPTGTGLYATSASMQKITLDNQLVLVNPELYSFEQVQIDVRDVGFIYTNLTNSFDEITGEYELYWVQWIDQFGGAHTGLLDASPTFHAATFADIDSATSTLDTESNSYISTIVGNSYILSMSRTSKYYYKYQNDNNIYAIPPTLTTINDPWFLSVGNGTFVNGGDVYSIPEFITQPFSPVLPIMIATLELTKKITSKAIKLQRENTAILYSGAAFPLHLDLVFSDKSTGDVERVLTTEPAKAGTQYLNAIHPQTGDPVKHELDIITSWDNAQGIVVLSEELVLDRYNVNANYYYFTTAYEYTAINVNPRLNPDVMGAQIILFCVPNAAATPGTDAIYHLVVRDGIIESASNAVLSLLIAGTLYSDFLVMFANYLILAEVTPICSTQPDGDFAIDIRQDGGGIKAEYENEAILANYRSAYFPGVAPLSGYEFPQFGGIVVKVPHTLHIDYGGELDDVAIRALVQKHMGAGEYAIIELDGVIPAWGSP